MTGGLTRRGLFAGIVRWARDVATEATDERPSPPVRPPPRARPDPAAVARRPGDARREAHADAPPHREDADAAERRPAGRAGSAVAAALLARVDAGTAAVGPARSATPQRRPAFLPLHRPPGSVEEPAFLARCTRCGDCFPACPHAALVPAPASMRGAQGTPMIVPGDAACRLCVDRPCATACEAGVIRADLPERMGVARIDVLDCMAWQSVPCSSCVERCPVEGALTTDLLVRPTVVADVCVGCGLCAWVCPAPRKAITIVADTARPRWSPAPRENA